MTVYHIGAPAIAKRLGYRSPKVIRRLYLEKGLPVLRRRNGKNPALTWMISEPLVLYWELTCARLQRQADLAELEAKARRRD